MELFTCFSIASCSPLLQDAEIQCKFTIFCASLNRKGICLITISHKLNPEFHEDRMSELPIISLFLSLSHTHTQTQHGLYCDYMN